jgi:hypothetical protein
MARFNEILVGRYNRFMQKLLSMKGDASLFQFSSEMGAYLPLFSGVENRYLEQWDRFGFVSTILANAASISGINIRNPVGSNVVAILEKLDLSLSASGQASTPYNLSFGVDLTDLASTGLTTNVNTRLDNRGRKSNTLVWSAENVNAAITPLPNNIASYILAAGASPTVQVINDEDQELTLLPGDGLRLQAGAVNLGVNMSVWWRERLLEESERA